MSDEHRPDSGEQRRSQNSETRRGPRPDRERRPYPPRNGERRTYPPRDSERRPYPPRDGERKPYPPRDGERRPFPPRDGERRPYPPDGERRPFRPRPVEGAPRHKGPLVQTDGMPARRIALDVIRKVTEEGAYASLALDEKLTGCSLSGIDRRLAARLVYDTLDNLIYLDHALNQVMAKPDTDIRLVNILRLGACQLLIEDRIPEMAATDTSVKLCEELGMGGLKGVCNGILRNLIRRKDELSWPDPETDPVGALSVRLSVPAWLVERLTADYGREQAEAILRERGQTGFVTIRPNLTRLSGDGLDALLARKVWEVSPGILPMARRVKGAMEIGRDADFLSGMFSIQSEGSMAACLAVAPKRGWKVLDACAAPGGKSCLMCEMMGDTGRVQAWELHAHRTRLIEAQARRLGLESIRPMTRDALLVREDLESTMDAVLLDAPCTGTGDMADKPDVKLRLTEEKLTELTALQRQLLDTVCAYVRPCGVLVYATCSILKDENERQVAAFLTRHPEFEAEPLPDTIPEAWRAHQTTGLQLLPSRDQVGGFYLCRMRRKNG